MQCSTSVANVNRPEGMIGRYCSLNIHKPSHKLLIMAEFLC